MPWPRNVLEKYFPLLWTFKVSHYGIMTICQQSPAVEKQQFPHQTRDKRQMPAVFNECSSIVWWCDASEQRRILGIGLEVNTSYGATILVMSVVLPSTPFTLLFDSCSTFSRTVCRPAFLNKPLRDPLIQPSLPRRTHRNLSRESARDNT